MIEIDGDYTRTNADKIREMSDSELVEIIMCPYDTEPDLCDKKAGCFDCCLEWLQRQEGEE